MFDDNSSSSKREQQRDVADSLGIEPKEAPAVPKQINVATGEKRLGSSMDSTRHQVMVGAKYICLETPIPEVNCIYGKNFTSFYHLCIRNPAVQRTTFWSQERLEP